MAGDIAVSATEAMKNLTLSLRVKGTRELRLRIAIGTWLLRLAGRVIGCRVETDDGYERAMKILVEEGHWGAVGVLDRFKADGLA